MPFVKLEPKKTALLTLDCQTGGFGIVPGAEAIIPNAARAVEFARQQAFQIIHVGLGFAAGHPEISEVETRFQQVKKNNAFVKGTPSAEFHSAIAHPGELVIHKQRVGAHSIWITAVWFSRTRVSTAMRKFIACWSKRFFRRRRRLSRWMSLSETGGRSWQMGMKAAGWGRNNAH
jgi:nicotinamidase-related amidase